MINCNQEIMKLKTVDKKIDLNKYSGKWYEIAKYPNKFQKDCDCATAEYLLSENEKHIIVTNRCKKANDNEWKEVNGKAFIADKKNFTKLKVQFFWPFKGDYWIIAIDDDYKWVVVSEPSRKYLWILSRSPQMKQETYDYILKFLKTNKFDLSKIVKSKQDC